VVEKIKIVWTFNFKNFTILQGHNRMLMFPLHHKLLSLSNEDPLSQLRLLTTIGVQLEFTI